MAGLRGKRVQPSLLPPSRPARGGGNGVSPKVLDVDCGRCCSARWKQEIIANQIAYYSMTKTFCTPTDKQIAATVTAKHPAYLLDRSHESEHS